MMPTMPEGPKRFLCGCGVNQVIPLKPFAEYPLILVLLRAQAKFGLHLPPSVPP